MARLIYVSFVTCLVAACGDDPISYSAPVGINLKAKSADTQNGVVTDEKSINSESGNPYGAFVADARAELGRDPGLIDVDSVALFLGANSTGVVTLGEVFDGNVEVLFEMNDTNNSYPVANATLPATTGPGPFGLSVTFPAAQIPDADFTKLLNGSFKVITRGPAASGFTTKGADADIQVTLTFAAYE
ncbi:MAG: hypothetical protein ACKV2T_00545 [Kofleriaceae bacterium]